MFSALNPAFEHYKFPSLQNLFDAIDLSDNEIVKLEGFPLLKRLTTLLLANNRIARISPLLGSEL